MTGRISQQPMGEFVKDKIAEQSKRHSQFEQPETLWYAGNVLVQFLENTSFHANCGDTRVPVLAELFGKATQAKSRSERALWLRRLGDTALFLGALFPENFERRGIRADYLVGMGGGAYSALATSSPPQTGVYQELASKFPRVMKILAEVCEKESLFDASDVVALYERWNATRDPLTKAQLCSLGITPISTSSRAH